MATTATRGGPTCTWAAPAGLGATPALTLTGEAYEQLFGCSVATAGDVNGDGYADVVVGAPATTATGADLPVPGRAAAGPGRHAGPDPHRRGQQLLRQFRGTAGDINGDGYAEVIVGAYGYNSYQGRAYVYSGNESLGLSLEPQARRADDSAPIAYLGKSELGAASAWRRWGASPSAAAW